MDQNLTLHVTEGKLFINNEEAVLRKIPDTSGNYFFLEHTRFPGHPLREKDYLELLWENKKELPFPKEEPMRIFFDRDTTHPEKVWCLRYKPATHDSLTGEGSWDIRTMDEEF